MIRGPRRPDMAIPVRFCHDYERAAVARTFVPPAIGGAAVAWECGRVAQEWAAFVAATADCEALSRLVAGANPDELAYSEEVATRRAELVQEFGTEFMAAVSAGDAGVPGALKREARQRMCKKLIEAIDAALSKHDQVLIAGNTRFGRVKAIPHCVACDRPLRSKGRARDQPGTASGGIGGGSGGGYGTGGTSSVGKCGSGIHGGGVGDGITPPALPSRHLRPRSAGTTGSFTTAHPGSGGGGGGGGGASGSVGGRPGSAHSAPGPAGAALVRQVRAGSAGAAVRAADNGSSGGEEYVTSAPTFRSDSEAAEGPPLLHGIVDGRSGGTHPSLSPKRGRGVSGGGGGGGSKGGIDRSAEAGRDVALAAGGAAGLGEASHVFRGGFKMPRPAKPSSAPPFAPSLPGLSGSRGPQVHE
ncbi:unnamed protein product [Phaeothamnion confervicola]